MKLAEILSQIVLKYRIIDNSYNPEQLIEDIVIDSRFAKKNSIFFGLIGNKVDGAIFATEVSKSGASAIVISEKSNFDYHKFATENPQIAVIVADSFLLLVEFLKIFYQPLPANIYGITGTNGKTSTSEFTRQILQFLGKKSASIGTLGINCEEEIHSHFFNSSLTTPDIVSLYKNLQILKKFGVDDVAIEVSSIGLDQKRIEGLEIAVGAFTNFSQDHLDYHKNMEQYFECKMLLFKKVLSEKSFAVLNSDIEQFQAIKGICKKRNIQVFEYGFNAKDLRIIEINNLNNLTKKPESSESKNEDLFCQTTQDFKTSSKNIEQKIKFEFKGNFYEFELSVSGDFQALNAICALANILAKHQLKNSEIKKLLKNFSSLKSAQGRMEKIAKLENGSQVFIDFAHTPDALNNALVLARKMTKNRVIILFGCGGDRDSKKRPLMGKIASKLADFVIITDDNPRSEEPATIRAEILKECDLVKTLEIADRRTAINKGIKMLKKDDILILAGKGHEKYQIIGTEKFEFDEKKITENAIKEIS